jgi:tetratricopeptide (TPR) repeat protein
MSAGAAIEYEKALAADGEDAFVAAKLSRTYLELERYAEAAKLATPLIELDENDASAATTLGLAHLATGEHEAAARAFELALRVSPFDPAVRCGLAEAYGSTGDGRSKREREACGKLR